MLAAVTCLLLYPKMSHMVSSRLFFLIPYAGQTQVVSSYCHGQSPNSYHLCPVLPEFPKAGPTGLKPQEGCPETRKVKRRFDVKNRFLHI